MATDKNVDVRALAKLARLEVSDEELSKLEKELPNILKFVETIQKVSGEAPKGDPMHRNIMREDTDPHEGDLYTEDILAAAPAHKQRQLVVKQVISRNEKKS